MSVIVVACESFKEPPSADDDDDSDEEGGNSHKRGKEEEGKPLIFHNEFATSLNPQQVYTNNVLMLRTILTK